MNETDSTIICISVTNPPLKDPLIISATFLSGPPTLITAGEQSWVIPFVSLAHIMSSYVQGYIFAQMSLWCSFAF